MNRKLQLARFLFFAVCFLPFSPPLSSQTPTASFATWKDNKRAAYTIIHDDYSNYIPGIFQNAYPLAKARGIKICFGAITNFCGTTEWNNAKTMIADGHECVNHSHNHKCGGTAGQCAGQVTYGPADFATELGTSTQFIETNTQVKPRFFIHPYDAPSDAIIEYLKTLGYLGSRAGTQLAVNPNSFTDFMRLNFYVYDGTPEALADLNPAVNAAIAAGGYAVREFHGIDDGIDPAAFKGFAPMTLANYTSHLDYVKTKIDDGSIWSATTTEAITYKMQRDAYNPALLYDAIANKITVAFTNLKTIDPSVLTTPVTLNVNIGSLAGNFTVTQNGNPVLFTRANTVISFNIYPHQGAVILQGQGIVPPPPPPPTACFANGQLTRTVWNAQPIRDVALTDITIPLVKAQIDRNNALPKVDFILGFSSRMIGTFFLEQLKGYYIPLRTGFHTFVITGNDDTDLYMSTDGDPNNKIKVAGFHGTTNDFEYNKYPNQRTRTMYLEAGKYYYVELWHLGIGFASFATVKAITPFSIFESAIFSVSSKNCNVVPPPAAQTTTRSFAISGYLEKDKAVLNWAIKSPDALDYFDIEKLEDKTGTFKKLDVVNANLPQNTAQSFSYTDDHLSEGDNFYRLKTVAQDATIQYSETVKVRYNNLGNYTLSPNPASEHVDIDLSQAPRGKAVDMAIVTLLGKVVYEYKIESLATTHYQIPLDNLENGQYFIRIQAQGKRMMMKKLMVFK